MYIRSRVSFTTTDMFCFISHLSDIRIVSSDIIAVMFCEQSDVDVPIVSIPYGPAGHEPDALPAEAGGVAVGVGSHQGNRQVDVKSMHNK